MPSCPAHYATILRFWRSIESFTLPDIPTIKKSDHLSILGPGMTLPWEPGRLPPPKEGKKWRHTLYFHLVPKEAVIDRLARLTRSRDFREPVSGDTCLSALTLDHHGIPSIRTYCPAAFIYGIKALREKCDPEILNDWLRTAHDEYLKRFGIMGPPSEPSPVTWPPLQKELDHLQNISHGLLLTSTPIRCISDQVSLTSTPEAAFLNSYYLTDLDNLIRHPQDIGRPLQLFLSPDPPLRNRIDLLDPKNLQKHIPKPPPPGRWPSDPAHGLYTAQYAALTITLSEKRPHNDLLAINGPPGTGKTTLLREIIANIIVTRARRLLTAGASGLFHPKRISISDPAAYYRPVTSIIGSDGIVVSGNNNAAIEHISKQLPLAQNIHSPSFPDADYFSVFASNILGEPGWGMLSAALGRSEKRSDFIDKFWFNKGKGFGKWLRQQYEDHEQARTNAMRFKTTAKQLRSLLADYDHAVTKLPPSDFLHLSPAEIHRLTPFSSEKLNALRSNIFLHSLQLHEWAIRCNARYFYHNLGSFVDMLSGKWRENIDEDIAATLWNSFFFCIPVVSVTLASFQRQFHNMGRGSIGWLLLDEAGQATPPSVCGALWRSRRCILIGDTQQIPPVVTIPETLGRILQDKYDIHDDDWSPLKHSAQYLADRVTTTGTLIRLGDDHSVWTGIPLRAHRRCHEPMFSIANALAYNGQMVQTTVAAPGFPAATVTAPGLPAATTPNAIPTTVSATEPRAPNAPPTFPTGPSGWIDVRGFTHLDGHAIAEELQIVEDLLQQLSTNPCETYIISPFRSIALLCRDRYTTHRICCGTIHTFQGKEADIVILILGTLPRSIAARNWVAAAPNILNVAITRAKHRLYVIGNRSIWSRHKHFDQLARHLPAIQHFSGRLF